MSWWNINDGVEGGGAGAALPLPPSFQKTIPFRQKFCILLNEMRAKTAPLSQYLSWVEAHRHSETIPLCRFYDTACSQFVFSESKVNKYIQICNEKNIGKTMQAKKKRRDCSKFWNHPISKLYRFLHLILDAIKWHLPKDNKSGECKYVVWINTVDTVDENSLHKSRRNNWQRLHSSRLGRGAAWTRVQCAWTSPTLISHRIHIHKRTLCQLLASRMTKTPTASSGSVEPP